MRTKDIGVSCGNDADAEDQKITWLLNGMATRRGG